MAKGGKKAKAGRAGPTQARPADTARKRGYEAAAPSRQSDGLLLGRRSADAEIFGEAMTLREKSRALVRNNPFAAKAVAALVSNIVGEGIVPRPVTGSPTKDRKIRQAFEQWTFRCDANGVLDFYGLQMLLCREMIEGGEALIRKRLRKPLFDGDVPLELQLLEADYLDPFRNGLLNAEGQYAIQGVVFDQKTLKRAAYWLFPNHPGNIFFNFPGSLTSVPVPANEVLHVYEWQRTQTRGVPWGTPAMDSLQLLADYELAEIVRKKIEASVTAFVINAESESDESIAPQVVDADGHVVEKFEPGLVSYLRGGKDVKFNTPQAVPNYAEYKASALMTIAAGYRVPYELVSGDLSKVNFSSMRGGLVEFRRLLRQVQWHILIQMALQPIWEWWCEMAFLAGVIDRPYVPVEWSPPKFEWVDPAAESAAALSSVRAGFRSYQDVVAETGRNPDDVLEEIADWNVKLDDRGITLDSDPRRTTAQGLQQKVEDIAPGEEPELSRPNRGAHGRKQAPASAIHPRRRGEAGELQRRRQHDRDRVDDRSRRPPVLVAGRRRVR